VDGGAKGIRRTGGEGENGRGSSVHGDVAGKGIELAGGIPLLPTGDVKPCRPVASGATFRDFDAALFLATLPSPATFPAMPLAAGSRFAGWLDVNEIFSNRWLFVGGASAGTDGFGSSDAPKLPREHEIQRSRRIKLQW
jgi:hypothetical protein